VTVAAPASGGGLAPDPLHERASVLWPEAQEQARDILSRASLALTLRDKAQRLDLVDLLAVAWISGATGAAEVAGQLAYEDDKKALDKRFPILGTDAAERSRARARSLLSACSHGEPIRFAAANLLKHENDRDPNYCGCCGAWLAGKATHRCPTCTESAT